MLYLNSGLMYCREMTFADNCNTLTCRWMKQMKRSQKTRLDFTGHSSTGWHSSTPAKMFADMWSRLKFVKSDNRKPLFESLDYLSFSTVFDIKRVLDESFILMFYVPKQGGGCLMHISSCTSTTYSTLRLLNMCYKGHFVGEKRT